MVYVAIPALSSCKIVKVHPAKHIYNSVIGVIFTHMYIRLSFSVVPHASDSSFNTIV